MSEEAEQKGRVLRVNGPIVTATGMAGVSMMDIAEVGPHRLVGEVIRLQGDRVVIQVYEDNTGLKPGDEVISSARPLAVMLGPGLISGIYDGIQRPLPAFKKTSGAYISRGVRASPLDLEKKWHFIPEVKPGDEVNEGSLLGTLRETDSLEHRVLLPPGMAGRIEEVVSEGDYTVEEEIYLLSAGDEEHHGRLAHYWPVRSPRPVTERLKADEPLVTGQRVIDTFFPITKGGTAAVPGGFGTGKTMTQHALAKWCDADVIVYIGCGERGNEMTDVLTEFPQLVDPRSGRPLMERTVMIANTSNMPVAAREASIYTGVTMAEYYRDMGYHVAVMADSTSRWAEALRELASRLGDMPAEEGFPPYLATRLAEFYERAGYVITLGERKGSISIIGAVSPPGGDFSEPVTQHTTRFVRTFWALDKELADARHYPSISWIDSYSEYIEEVGAWWEVHHRGWNQLRRSAMEILQEENRLEQIVRLVGPDALPLQDRFLLFCAEIMRNAFLQQNSFDPNDMFCSPGKQVRILAVIVDYYRRGRKLLAAGADLHSLIYLETVTEISRLKSEYGSDALDELDTFAHRLETELQGIGGPEEKEEERR